MSQGSGGAALAAGQPIQAHDIVLILTRTEAIAAINAHLSKLDDEELELFADAIQGLVDDAPIRELTPEEMALVEQSKEDFRLGRTLIEEEYRIEMEAFMAAMRARHASTVRGA